MSHKCPRNGCEKQVKDDQLCCPKDWYKVPAHLRRAVWLAWQNGDGAGTPEHNAAITAAIKALNNAG